MIIGVDYYPEHWDEKMWTADAELMAKTGVKLVRLGEFAWCRLEPSDGCFDFSWLDRAIEIFAERGINVVLGTPTNCPPRWLCEEHPEVLPWGSDGKPNPIGVRGHRCYNSPVFIEYAQRIVSKLAEHYKDNGAVAAWQIDNELDAGICYCGTCNEKHRRWLKRKYGTLEALNKAYGNVVWSGEYSSWEQIDPPYGGYNKAWLNPAYMLDFSRRAAEDVTEFCNMQAELIRSFIPDAKITTNTWFCESMPDFYRMFEKLDFVSYDNYPTVSIPNDTENIYTHAVHLDIMRGIKRKNFCIMEQLSGMPGCWTPMSKTPRPGMIKGYALQAFAHGADTVVLFRWRTAAIGAEMHWHGIIDHSNVPGRRFEEFAELCREAENLSKLRGTELRSKVAVLYSTESEYAFKLQPQTDGMYYMEQIKLLHSAFAGYGVNVDIIGQHEDLSGYKVVCAPEMYITDESVARRLYDFAEKGGTVILTTRSGVKDENNNCIVEQLPAVYARLTGCRVEEYDPIGWDTVKVKFEDGEVFTARQWCDVLQTDTAEVIARYDGNFYRGKPAVTVNRFGSGKAYYIGTVGEKKLYRKIALEILEDTDIEYIKGLPDNVEVTVRAGDGISARFIFNNTDAPQSFVIDGKRFELLPFEMTYTIGKF